jgi:ABC-type bacteriocin/lantibiotic exporter with double-glycine peptidase domain
MIDLHIGAQTFDFDCGAKALQMVMAYYGVEVREDELIEALGTGAEGTASSDMVVVAQRHGFQVKACCGWALREVERTVNGGDPVIVLLQAWADRYMTIEDWRKDYMWFRNHRLPSVMEEIRDGNRHFHHTIWYQ